MPRNLIVGVDYGTTFTGVSYAWSDAQGVSEIYVVCTWPSNGDGLGIFGHQTQVPSKISYMPEEQWGHAIKAGAEAFCWTKLLLDRHTLATEYDDKGLRQVDGGGILTLPSWKSAEEVVTDFLTHLYKHIMEYLAGKVTSPILAVTAIEWWFTVPAVWSLRAQEATRKAACMAGFASRPGDMIHMIKEPEAAAMACLHLTKRENKDLIKAGDGILICDCGGGTVDLASYVVKSLSPKLLLDQVCVSEGGKCGSTSIDRAFHGLMQQRFGAAFTNVAFGRKGANSKFMNEFESRKRAFGALNPNHDITYRLTLVFNPKRSEFYDEDTYEVLLARADMKSLFDPVVENVIALLKQQIKASNASDGVIIKTIFLVGGFGSSPYLQQRLRDTFPDLNIPDLARNEEAISLGATLCGLEGRGVQNRKARDHIGFRFDQEFRPSVDSEATAYIDWFNGEKMTPNRMAWIIGRGETITHETERSTDFTCDCTRACAKKWQLDLWQSTAHEAPDFLGDDVRQVGVIDIDLTALDLTTFPSKRKAETGHPYKANRYYRVEYEVVIVPEDDLGYMQFKVLVQGERVGEARLRIGGKVEE